MGRGKAAATIEMIEMAAEILRESDYPLTVRRLFYELVSKGLIENNEDSYRSMTTKFNDARWDGDLPAELFDRIVDGGREPVRTFAWGCIADFARSAAAWYKRNRWEYQSAHVELWVEKQAVVSLLEDVCRRNQVTLRPLHGFNSFTAIHQTADELIPIRKNITIFYLGDHDVHGYEIERDAQDRLFRMFNLLGRPGKRNMIDFRPRLGILPEDIGTFGIYPLNVLEMEKGGDNYLAKREAFVAKYGNEAAEVDGLPTEEMIRRVQRAINMCVDDHDAWGKADLDTEDDRMLIVDLLTA